MADFRLPSGSPTKAHSAEDVLLQGHTDILRSRSVYVPPRSQGVRADVVPKRTFRKAMANSLIRQAQAKAVEHDARDLALNYRVQAVKESTSALAPPYSDKPALRTPDEQVDAELHAEYEAARSRFGL